MVQSWNAFRTYVSTVFYCYRTQLHTFAVWVDEACLEESPDNCHAAGFSSSNSRKNTVTEGSITA